MENNNQQFTISDILPSQWQDRGTRNIIRRDHIGPAVLAYFGVDNDTNLQDIASNVSLPNQRAVDGYVQSQPDLFFAIDDTAIHRGSSQERIESLRQNYILAGAFALQFFNTRLRNLDELPRITMRTILASQYDQSVSRPGPADTAYRTISYRRLEEPLIQHRLSEAVARAGAAETVPEGAWRTTETGLFEMTAYLTSMYLIEQAASTHWANRPKKRGTPWK